MMEKRVTITILDDGVIQTSHIGLSKIELLGIAEFLRSQVNKALEPVPPKKAKKKKKK